MGKKLYMQTRLIVLICLLLSSVSCQTESKKAPAFGTKVTEQQIGRLRPGMTAKEVIQICGETIPTSIGAFWYPSTDGQSYVCHFMGTREVREPGGRKGRLAAVVKVPRGEHAYSTNGVYVIPGHLKSHRFTGLSLD